MFSLFCRFNCCSQVDEEDENDDDEEEEGENFREAALKIAKKFAGKSKIDAKTALQKAREEFPTFSDDFMKLVLY